jgi:hypothetical protein
MLVSENIVKRWYQRDSWVYKHFSYLFSNPIWKKRVPQGFSVCPYFWMAIFSMLIFRPLVAAPIVYVILPILKLIGKPAYAVDAFLWRKYMGDKEYQPGVGTAITLGGVTLGVFAIYLVIAYVVWSFQLYNYVAGPETGSTLGKFFFWSAQSFLALLATILVHKGATKSTCKTFYYLWVWAWVFFSAAVIIIPGELWQGTKFTVSGLLSGVVYLAGLLWWVLKYVGVFLGTWIWKIASFVPFAELPYVPWWGYVLALGAIGFAIHKFVPMLDQEPREFEPIQPRNMTEAEIIADNRRAWVNLFLRVIKLSKGWRTPDWFLNTLWITSGTERHALAVMYQDLLQKGVEKFFKTDLDVLQAEYPLVNYDGYQEWLVEFYGDTEDRFRNLGEALQKPLPVELKRFHCTMFAETMVGLTKPEGELHEEFKQRVEFYESLEVDREKKRIARTQTWHHQACQKVTGIIADCMSGLWNGLVTVVKETGTLIAYGWTLAKAKKKGACPYLVFTDKPQPKKQEPVKGVLKGI